MEVECKLQLDAAAVGAVRQRLVEAAAVPHGVALQVDTYFHHPARDLVASDEAFRLREAGGYELTYKGPRSVADLKVRPELNLAVADDPTPLLRALGFVPAATLAKRREAWSMPRCEVALDHIDGLGWFVEIEARRDEPDPADAIHEARRALGLASHAIITDSYLGMALAAGAVGAARVL